MILIISGHPLLNLKELAKSIGVRFGINFVDIDEKTLYKNKGIFDDLPSKNSVYCGDVLANKVDNAVKIYLKNSEEVLIKKIIDEQKIDFEDAKNKLKEIETKKAKHLNKIFGIDCNNLDVYDLIINIDHLDNEGIISVIEKYVNKVKKKY